MIRFTPRDDAPFDPNAPLPYDGALSRLLQARGMRTPAEAERFLDPALNDLLPPSAIPNLLKAVGIALDALRAGDPVVVYGDYDVDGVCAVTILTEALASLGARVSRYIPPRSLGYGLHKTALYELTRRRPRPKLLITVDLGVTNVAEVAYAREMGLRVIVTDHHQLGDALPDADAVVTQRLADGADCVLCGAGVSFKLAQGLLEAAAPDEAARTAARAEAFRRWMPLAALATIADIVPLTGENRVIAAFGLRQMPYDSRAGLRALLMVSGITELAASGARGPLDTLAERAAGGMFDATAATPDADASPAPPARLTLSSPQLAPSAPLPPVSSGKAAFQIAPRINAVGRLGDADTAVRLLTATDPNDAMTIARELDEENRRRKEVEHTMLREAFAQAETQRVASQGLVWVVGEDWNKGVVGLVAGRLCEKYHMPAAAFSLSEDTATGSFRSISGVHIQRMLTLCERFLTRYGGHEQAAGATLPRAELAPFLRALSDTILAECDPDCFAEAVRYDVPLALSQADEALAAAVERFAPTGFGNPAPAFLIEGARVDSFRRVGAEGAHLQATLRQAGDSLRAIGFSMGARADALPDAVDAVCALSINEFRGERSVQLELKALRPASGEELRRIDALGDEFLLSLLQECRTYSAKLTFYPSDEGGAPDAPDAARGIPDAPAVPSAPRPALPSLEPLLSGVRGTLLVAQTRQTARDALSRFGNRVSLALRGAEDPRAGHTLLALCPLSRLPRGFRHVVLLDGALCPAAEADARAAAFAGGTRPDEGLIALPVSAALRADLAALDPGDDALRTLYRALRRGSPSTARQLALSVGLTLPQTMLGLCVLSELGLAAFTETPFLTRLLPPVKRSLADSRLLTLIRHFVLSS